jgi:hypothetical protein
VRNCGKKTPGIHVGQSHVHVITGTPMTMTENLKTIKPDRLPDTDIWRQRMNLLKIIVPDIQITGKMNTFETLSNPHL